MSENQNTRVIPLTLGQYNEISKAHERALRNRLLHSDLEQAKAQLERTSDWEKAGLAARAAKSMYEAGNAPWTLRAAIEAREAATRLRNFWEETREKWPAMEREIHRKAQDANTWASQAEEWAAKAYNRYEWNRGESPYTGD